MRPHSRLNLLAVGIFYSALLGLALLWNSYQPLILLPRPLGLWNRGLGLQMLLAGGAAALTISLSWLNCLWLPAWRRIGREIRELIYPLTHHEIFLLAAFSALGEEFFFRGIVQGKLGLWWASLLFGLLHIGPRRYYLLWTAFALLVGLLLGVLYQETGNILAPTLAHFLINAANLYGLRFLRNEPAADENAG